MPNRKALLHTESYPQPHVVSASVQCTVNEGCAQLVCVYVEPEREAYNSQLSC